MLRATKRLPARVVSCYYYHCRQKNNDGPLDALELSLFRSISRPIGTRERSRRVIELQMKLKSLAARNQQVAAD